MTEIVIPNAINNFVLGLMLCSVVLLMISLLLLILSNVLNVISDRIIFSFLIASIVLVGMSFTIVSVYVLYYTL